MKSNSVFWIFVAAIVLAGILLSRLFAHAPEKIAEDVEQKTAAALATTPAPSPSPSPAAPTPQTVSVPASASASAPSPGLLADFSAQATHALDMIPTNAEIEKLSTEQVHFTPKAVIDAATEIGRVSEMIQAHPELSLRGLEFYKTCAENDASVEAIRATCLSDFNNLQTRSKQKVTPPKVPKRIASLAEKLS